MLERFSLTAKKPEKGMTNEEWQEYFALMKVLTKQTKERLLKRSSSPIINGYYVEGQLSYQGETQWERYKEFINSVLKTIRKGEYDYCFYIYQISELLRFEHDNLRTLWLPDERYFQVWLEK